MKRLTPTLGEVEERLCGPSDSLIARFLQGDPSLPADMGEAIDADPRARERVACARDALQTPFEFERPPAEVGDDPNDGPSIEHMYAMQRLMDKRNTARARFEDVSQAMPGQVRLVEEIAGPAGVLEYDLPVPLCVLLDAPFAGRPDVWRAFMVSPDAEYASPWDLILESEDEPLDPLAASVQCWNQFPVLLKTTSSVVGQLSESRLASVQALASDYVSGEEVDASRTEPGRLVTRQLGDHTVLTGTPIGTEESGDPRWQYQLLYNDAAEPLRLCAMEALGIGDFDSDVDESPAGDAVVVDFALWLARTRAIDVSKRRAPAKMAAGSAEREFVFTLPLPYDGMLRVRLLPQTAEIEIACENWGSGELSRLQVVLTDGEPPQPPMPDAVHAVRVPVSARTGRYSVAGLLSIRQPHVCLYLTPEDSSD